MGLDKGLLSYLSSFFTSSKLALIEKVLSARTKHLAVVIEDIYQPHNASAVIRSCDCFGIQHVYFIENKNKYQVNPKITMGATKWVSIQRFTSTPADNATARCMEELKKKGYRIVATSPHHKHSTPETIALDQPLAVFFGNEKEGLSDYVLEGADDYIYVPMYGFTESLNISVSAAMVMKTLYERIIDPREKIDWQLQVEDKNELRLDWLRKSLKKSDYIIDDYYKNNNTKAL